MPAIPTGSESPKREPVDVFSGTACYSIRQ